MRSIAATNEAVIEYSWSEWDIIQDDQLFILDGGSKHCSVQVRDLEGLKKNTRYVSGPDGKITMLRHNNGENGGFARQINPHHPNNVRWFNALRVVEYFGIEGFTILEELYARTGQGYRFRLKKVFQITYLLDWEETPIIKLASFQLSAPQPTYA